MATTPSQHAVAIEIVRKGIELLGLQSLCGSTEGPAAIGTDGSLHLFLGMKLADGMQMNVGTPSKIAMEAIKKLRDSIVESSEMQILLKDEAKRTDAALAAVEKLKERIAVLERYETHYNLSYKLRHGANA